MRDCDMQCGNISYRCNIPHREVPAVDRCAAAGWAEDGKGRSASMAAEGAAQAIEHRRL